MNLCTPSLNTRASALGSSDREFSYCFNDLVTPKAACSLHDMPTTSLAAISAYGEGLKLVDRTRAPLEQQSMPHTIGYILSGEVLPAPRPVSSCHGIDVSWVSNTRRIADMGVNRSIDRMGVCHMHPGVGLKDPFHHNRRHTLTTPATRSTVSSVDTPPQQPARPSSTDSVDISSTLDSPTDMVVEYKMEEVTEIASVSPMSSPSMSYKKLDHRRNAFRESSMMRRRSSPSRRRRMRDRNAILARMRKSLAKTHSTKKESLRGLRDVTASQREISSGASDTSTAVVLPSQAAEAAEATDTAVVPTSKPSPGATSARTAVRGAPPTEMRSFAPSQA